MASDSSFSVSQTEAQDALTNFWPKILEELRGLGNVRLLVITDLMEIFKLKLFAVCCKDLLFITE